MTGDWCYSVNHQLLCSGINVPLQPPPILSHCKASASSWSSSFPLSIPLQFHPINPPLFCRSSLCKSYPTALWKHSRWGITYLRILLFVISIVLNLLPLLWPQPRVRLVKVGRGVFHMCRVSKHSVDLGAPVLPVFDSVSLYSPLGKWESRSFQGFTLQPSQTSTSGSTTPHMGC